MLGLTEAREAGTSNGMEGLRFPVKKARVSSQMDHKRVQVGGQDLIDDLPDELLVHIFSFIPAIRDRCCCGAVSKKWSLLQASMPRSDYISRGFLLPRPTQEISRSFRGSEANDTRLVAMAIGIDARGVLTNLSVIGTLTDSSPPPPSGHRSISDVGLSIVAGACKSLKSLSLFKCPKITGWGIGSVGHCIGLERLELVDAMSVTDDGLVILAIRCLNLSSLSLVSCPNVGNHSLQAFAKYSRKLKSVTLASCPLITDSGIVSLVANRSGLETVKIASMKLSDIVLQAIACYSRKIQILLLDNVWGVSDMGYCWIGLARELKCLVLKACVGLSDRCLARVSSASFAGIRKLAINNCSLISDWGLFELTSSARELENVLLHSCKSFTYRGLMVAIGNCSQSLKTLALIKCDFLDEQRDQANSFPLAQHCPLLETVKVDQCRGIGDDFILWIGASCKQVTDVSFTRMDSITDRGIRCFLSQLKGSNKMARVDLTGCTRVGNWSVWAITRECKASLKRLVLRGCGRVNDRGAAVIARRCAKLVELDLGGCDISDEGVKKLARDEPIDLEVISLAGCTRITDRSLLVLKKYMGPGLERVNVAGCTGVSKAVINWLKLYIDEVDY